MDVSFTTLAVPSFIAGFLMFIAPCTLPLVPGFLAYIAGLDPEILEDNEISAEIRLKVVKNAFFYTLGFTTIFVLFGVLVGIVGAQLTGLYREVLTKIAGSVVILFGLFMLDVMKISWLQKSQSLKLGFLKKGRPESSFVLGAAFAFGWTPCIGPILASVLLLASTSGTILDGFGLLLIFSFGLAIPYLLLAWTIGTAYQRISAMTKYMGMLSKIGGVFLIILGILLFQNQLGLFISYGYDWFGGFGYERLLDFY